MAEPKNTTFRVSVFMSRNFGLAACVSTPYSYTKNVGFINRVSSAITRLSSTRIGYNTID
jgi:hypothetical protein